MNKIIQAISDNLVDYESLPIHSVMIKKSPCDVNVIFPVRGRRTFLKGTLRSMSNVNETGFSVSMTVVEHSHVRVLEEIAHNRGANYIHITCGADDPFNKCLCMNVGALFSIKSEWFLFHDSDLIVRSDFIKNIFNNIANKELVATQTFNNRRVLNCDIDSSHELIYGDIDPDELSRDHEGVSDTNGGKAPGGSIMIYKDMFFNVGGFDPELFHSYAPEDEFFWDKVSLYTKMGSCDEPINEVFHLYHPLQKNNNPYFVDMMKLYNEWRGISPREKKRVCEYKRNLINQYYVVY